jgi:hypothetical protein
MKLYATVTSERATKGQGGKYLDINIKGDNGIELANIKVTSSYPYEYNIDIFPVVYDAYTAGSAYKTKIDIKGNGYKVTQAKGKKQKDDIGKGLEALGRLLPK